MSHHTPDKIVSGGQTGVDRGALDAAIHVGVPHGGWCPAGRIAEDGIIPADYELREHSQAAYPARTEQNVIDSDATLILYEGRLSGGTALTKRLARTHARPHFAIRIDDRSMMKVREWIDEVQPLILNVAGPRESTCPGIARRTLLFMVQVLTSSGVSLFSPDD